MSADSPTGSTRTASGGRRGSASAPPPRAARRASRRAPSRFRPRRAPLAGGAVTRTGPRRRAARAAGAGGSSSRRTSAPRGPPTPRPGARGSAAPRPTRVARQAVAGPCSKSLAHRACDSGRLGKDVSGGTLHAGHNFDFREGQLLDAVLDAAVSLIVVVDTEAGSC